jgi:hypothetical protein
MAFGRKGLAEAQPRPAIQEDSTEAALAMLSQALGVDLDFDIAYIFAPVLWSDPRIGPELDAVPLKAEMAGNKMALLRNPAVAEQFRQRPAGDPMKEALLAAGFGLYPFDRGKPGGFDDGKTRFQQAELLKIAASPASAEAHRYAVLNLHEWSYRLMRGEIQL